MSSEHGKKLKPQGEAVIFLVYDRDENCVFLEEIIKPGSGYYGYVIIPGGKIEELDPSSMDAVNREVWEEMGIRPSSFGEIIYLDSFLEMSLNGNFRNNHAFLVNGFEGEVVDKEPEKARLLKVDILVAKNYLELASSKYIIDLARGKLGM